MLVVIYLEVGYCVCSEYHVTFAKVYRRYIDILRDSRLGLRCDPRLRGIFYPPDNFLNIQLTRNDQIVLANASIIEATVTKHEDLFRALKGGGGSFGIVTGFRLDVFPLKSFHTGFITYAWSSLSQVMQAIQSFNENAHLDPISSTTLSIAYDPTLSSQTITIALSRVGETLDSPILTPFFRIPHIYVSRQQMKPSQVAELFDDNNPSGFRYALSLNPPSNSRLLTDQGTCDLCRQYKSTFAIQNDASLATHITQTFRSRCSERFGSPSDPGFRVGFLLQPLTAQHLSAGKLRGGNSLGLHKSRPLLRKLLRL